jgi:hypothetical protein
MEIPNPNSDWNPIPNMEVEDYDSWLVEEFCELFNHNQPEVKDFVKELLTDFILFRKNFIN